MESLFATGLLAIAVLACALSLCRLRNSARAVTCAGGSKDSTMSDSCKLSALVPGDTLSLRQMLAIYHDAIEPSEQKPADEVAPTYC
jgi:hypothetical protein